MEDENASHQILGTTQTNLKTNQTLLKHTCKPQLLALKHFKFLQLSILKNVQERYNK
jgi:hypothetical protein